MIPLRVSRTAIEIRRQCQVKRYWQFEAMGTGLEPVSVSLPLIGGQTGHAALAPIIMGEPVDQVIAEQLVAYEAEVRARGITGIDPELLEFTIAEQQTLLEGLIRGWVRFRLPQILEEFEPVMAEEEWLVRLAPDFELPLRVDCLLRHRGSETLAILDGKFNGYERDGWLESKLHDLQTVLYVEAAEKHLGEWVDGIMYESLLKGGRRMAAKSSPFDGRELQQSPLCYGYKVESKDGLSYQSDYTARKGARQIAIWEEMAPEEWWQAYVLEDDYRNLYSTTGLISPPPEERQHVVEQVARAERAYAQKLLRIRTAIARGMSEAEAVVMYLEPDEQHCYAFGTRHRCPVYDLHYNGVVADDPLDSGLYRRRVDHHAAPAVAAPIKMTTPKVLEGDSAHDTDYWRFVKETADAADRMPEWMKGGTSQRPA